MNDIKNTKTYKLMAKAAQHFKALQKEAGALTVNPEVYEENKELFKGLEDQVEVIASFCIFHLEKVLCSLNDAHKKFAHNELRSIYEQIGQILNETKKEDEKKS